VTIGGELLETTPEHPFYTSDNEWVAAGELEVGDDIRRADGSYREVEAIEFIHQPQVMYNLTVDEAHTFFVGDGQWLVHNTCTLLPYERGGGHHIHAQAAFRDDPNYNPNQALALPASDLSQYDHAAMTRTQRRLYDQLALDISQGRRTNTLHEHNLIAAEALIAGGVPRTDATIYVNQSEQWLISRGIRIYRIPWN
jgi:hypothetical protein